MVINRSESAHRHFLAMHSRLVGVAQLFLGYAGPEVKYHKTPFFEGLTFSWVVPRSLPRHCWLQHPSCSCSFSHAPKPEIRNTTYT